MKNINFKLAISIRSGSDGIISDLKGDVVDYFSTPYKMVLEEVDHEAYQQRITRDIRVKGVLSLKRLWKFCPKRKMSTSFCFPNGMDDLMNFEVTIRPDEGTRCNSFSVREAVLIPNFTLIHTHEAPEVKCKTKVDRHVQFAKPALTRIYHPNIDLEGNISDLVDALNQDAAAGLRDNPKLFESNVREGRWLVGVWDKPSSFAVSFKYCLVLARQY
ncbi:hypothetical protein SADUNF_Sadunf04G0107400 [Salix dunnii]|uniref:Uncharacterized protein n=1 Tax=Salix dunnii TaxID=1413687 RepID=A0A835K997_9ROSI|nr:hypothetical protein SADUNF_Sadunf04G0107400 [Salix dunnii]